VKVELAVLVAAAALLAPTANAAAPGASDVNALLRGIPQRGAWLGKPTAPLIVVEYVDLQCPYCAVFSRKTLPPIIRSHVRTGKVRILFRGLAFVGADSQTALRWTYGAAGQNKLWNVLELLFVSQGGENEGWVTQPLLEGIARSVPGLDLAQLTKDAPRTGLTIAAAAAAAKTARVPGTPYLQAGRSLARLQPLRLKSLESRDLAAQLDALLR
jgi:protein-disulfide isomerase